MTIIRSEALEVLFTGSLRDYTRRQARAALALAGGTSCYDAKNTFDVAVVGSRAGKKDLEIIVSQGKPQLDEAQFKQLVQFGELELEAKPVSEEASVGESVGELRAILDGEPSPQKWRDIIAVLDQTEPERLAEVVAYVEGHISRWPLDESRRWHTSIVQSKLPDSASWVGGDLRVAPKHWVQQLLAGEDSEKFSVVRAISLEGTKVTSSVASKIFGSAHLEQLLHFDCGRDLKLTKTFFKKLAQCESMKNLETLIYYPYKKSGGGAELAKSTNFDSLKHLKIRYADYGMDHSEGVKDLQELFLADWISQIESLESNMGGSPYVSCSSALMNKEVFGAYGEHFKSLKRLMLGDYVSPDHMQPYEAVFARVEVIGVVSRSYYHATYTTWHSPFRLFEGLAKLKVKALHTIDLSQLMTYDGDRDERSQKAMTREFAAHPISGQIKRVYVSEHVTKAALTELEALKGVEVVTL